MYSYTQKGSTEVAYWDARAGKTIAGPACRLLSDMNEEFYLVGLTSQPKLSAALTGLPFDNAAEPGRLIGSGEDALRHPAVRAYVTELETSLPGSVAQYCRIHMLTTPDAEQKLHNDIFTTKGVRSILTLATSGITKKFTLCDNAEAQEVTLSIPHGTQFFGTPKFFGVEPHLPVRYQHGVTVEANGPMNGDGYVASVIVDLAGITIKDCKQHLLPPTEPLSANESDISTAALNCTGKQWNISREARLGGQANQARLLAELGPEKYSSTMSQLGKTGGTKNSSKQMAQRKGIFTPADRAAGAAKRTSNRLERVRRVAGSHTHKHCPTCQEVKEVTEFGTRNINGKEVIASTCSSCCKKSSAASRANRKAAAAEKVVTPEESSKVLRDMTNSKDRKQPQQAKKQKRRASVIPSQTTMEKYFKTT